MQSELSVAEPPVIAISPHQYLTKSEAAVISLSFAEEFNALDTSGHHDMLVSNIAAFCDCV